tara:strand:+ start:883 stop:1014 length:132 start_codon:yes stop_codon:yes gene_type:complete
MPNADDDTTPKVSENTETTAEKPPQGGNAIRQARIREQFSKKQ